MQLILAADKESDSFAPNDGKGKEEEDDWFEPSEPSPQRTAADSDAEEPSSGWDEPDDGGEESREAMKRRVRRGRKSARAAHRDDESSSDGDDPEDIGNGWRVLNVPAENVTRDLLAYNVEGPLGFKDCVQPIDYFLKFVAPEDLREVVETSEWKRTYNPDLEKDMRCAR